VESKGDEMTTQETIEMIELSVKTFSEKLRVTLDTELKDKLIVAQSRMPALTLIVQAFGQE